MLGPNPFFKQTQLPRTMVATENDRLRGEAIRAVRDKFNQHNNTGVRMTDAHPRFGYKTMLNQDTPKILPTAPAIVGGNVDWTMKKVSPATEYLHSVLSTGRPMQPPPALGSLLKLGEPSINSIHTTY